MLGLLMFHVERRAALRVHFGFGLRCVPDRAMRSAVRGAYPKRAGAGKRESDDEAAWLPGCMLLPVHQARAV